MSDELFPLEKRSGEPTNSFEKFNIADLSESGWFFWAGAHPIC